MVESNYFKVLENYNILSKIEKLKEISKKQEVVFLCVGNPKIWFDSFGPMMGSLLKYLNLEKFIYGNLKSPIKAENLEQYVNMIYRFHINPFVVVIDSAISKASNIQLKIKEGAIKCACLSDNPLEVGDMSIMLCISKEKMLNSNNYKVLLNDVKKLSWFINYVFKL